MNKYSEILLSIVKKGINLKELLNLKNQIIDVTCFFLSLSITFGALMALPFLDANIFPKNNIIYRVVFLMLFAMTPFLCALSIFSLNMENIFVLGEVKKHKIFKKLSPILKKSKKLKNPSNLFYFLLSNSGREMVVENLEIITEYAIKNDLYERYLSYLNKEGLTDDLYKALVKNDRLFEKGLNKLSSKAAVKMFFSEEMKNLIKSNMGEDAIKRIKSQTVLPIINDYTKGGRGGYEKEMYDISQEVNCSEGLRYFLKQKLITKYNGGRKIGVKESASNRLLKEIGFVKNENIIRF